MSPLTHSELCAVAAHWVRKHWRTQWVVAVEPNLEGEQPDVYAVDSSGCSTVIEVKISRADWRRDKRKCYRRDPARGLGTFRAFCAPRGMLKMKDLEDGWGLLEYSIDPKHGHRLEITREPQYNDERNERGEAKALVWLGRRGVAGASPGVWWRPYNPDWLLTEASNGLPDLPQVCRTLDLGLD